MTKPDDPANPLVYDPIDTTNVYEGLTKREYFAAMALQGLCSTGSTILMDGKPIQADPRTLAIGAVNFADELIKSLNK